MQRTSTKQKLLNGTLVKSREAKRRAPADPKRELQKARQLLSDMRWNFKLAGDAIHTYGMRMEFVSLDKNKHAVRVLKSNPALKVQADAIRWIRTLTAEIQVLEEHVAEAEKKKITANESQRFQRHANED
jgi:hypothetical protein